MLGHTKQPSQAGALLIITAMLVMGIIGAGITVLVQNKCLQSISTVVSEVPYELQLVQDDLRTYGHLSQRRIDEYLRALREGYEEDNIPIGLTHAIACIESDYRHQLEHDRVKVSVKGKDTEVRAVGTGGIIWELWKDSLIAHNRALSRDDLFMPYDAVRSMTLILKILIKEEATKGRTDLINRVLIRYYGAYSSLYYEKTIKVTSTLWMKRMNLFLNKTYHQEKVK